MEAAGKLLQSGHSAEHCSRGHHHLVQVRTGRYSFQQLFAEQVNLFTLGNEILTDSLKQQSRR